MGKDTMVEGLILDAKASNSAAPPVNWKQKPKQRRARIRDLMRQGLRPTTIAQIMGVSVPTVSKDMKAVGKQLQKEIRGFNQKAAVAGYRERFQFLYEKAMEEYHSTPKAPRQPRSKKAALLKDKFAKDRRDWLKYALEALAQALDLDLKVGLIEQASDKHVHEMFVVETQSGKVDLRSAPQADLVAVLAQQLERIEGNSKVKELLAPLLKLKPPKVIDQDGSESPDDGLSSESGEEAA